MSFDPVKMEVPTRAELFDFHGVAMTKIFTNNWENIQNFKARPDDILIATYPKAGTTWVCYILDLLYFGDSSERLTSIPIYERIPFLEKSTQSPSMYSGKRALVFCDVRLQNEKRTALAENLTITPRLIKTHYPVQFVPKSFWEQNCKIVYVARNAKDNMVSFYHFNRMNLATPEPGDWNSYIHRFMEGKMMFGSWYDHVNNWWKKKQTYQNIHYMFYEDMIEDTGREIDKLCSFLGLSPSAEEKRRITAGVQFDNMKKDGMANFSTNPIMDFKVSAFMRKGKVGDWKNHFTVAQNEEFDEDYKRRMTDPTLKFRSEI